MLTYDARLAIELSARIGRKNSSKTITAMNMAVHEQLRMLNHTLRWPGTRGVVKLSEQAARSAYDSHRKRSLSLQERLKTHLEAIYFEEIRKRGGTTEVGTKNQTWELSLMARGKVKTSTGSHWLSIMRVEGWQRYGRTGNRYKQYSYLCGRDDNGTFAVRLPGTVANLEDAIRWLEPIAVQQAHEGGRRILRQGDVYAVETTKKYDGKGLLPANHVWDPQTRTLTHVDSTGRPHKPLHIEWPCRFFQQRTYQMRRRGGWGGGD